MEESSLQIREAQPADIDSLINIEASAAQLFAQDEVFADLPQDKIQTAELHQSYIQSKNSWVALFNDQPIGFINGVEHGNTFHICKIAVAYEQQNQGVGRELLIYLENILKNRNIQLMTLTTFRNVPWNALFYEKQGFVDLADNELSLFLMDVLEEETAAGFEPYDRCAMQKSL